MYPIIAVPSVADGQQLEQQGSKDKFWYDDRRMLFKEGRPGTGENWAEKVAAELAARLGIPHATYELALSGDKRGVATPNFVPAGARLIHGNEIVARISNDEINDRQSRRRIHTVGRVTAFLSAGIHLPEGWVAPCEGFSAVDVFSGYLMLDALIGNQDRHEENWAVIWHGGTVRLAPTFDHASSLGRNETDQNREIRMNTKDSGRTVRAYAARATTPLYGLTGEGTHSVFREFSSQSHLGREHWLDALHNLRSSEVEDIVGQVPTDWMSEIAKAFTVQLVVENRELLLAGK